MFITIIFISFNFLMMNHPLAMGLILLLQSLFISLFTGMQLSSYWFSYILFLVFLGGLMVLFIYVTSLASNEMFSFQTTNILMFMFALILMLLFYMLFDPWFNTFMTYINSMNTINAYNTSLMMFKLYSYPISLLTLFLILYLLLTLVAVVNITKYLSGPLRTLN
uniref:NADH-ubiquinone oxidoreductase chain 6 n=1 Tax=Choroterpes yixingensis TaxID=2861365 RepID=A0A8F7CKN2_9INSE|nr:NADH dehydrogenase subunit 6 [Choroterpes yixingensis]